VRRSRFEKLVAEALDGLPSDFQEKIDNVEVVIEDWPSRQQLRKMGVPHGDSLYGTYEGVPLTKRTSRYGLVMPDRITIYQRPIEACCRNEDEIRRQVRRVVLHEVAHYFGISDERLRELDAY
jgi:predicted Zn-dependent protease with MMP-like domain